MVVLLYQGDYHYFFLLRYSEHIILTKEAKEIFFSLATFFNSSYSSDGILIFKDLSFKFNPPFLLQRYYNNCSKSRVF
jgi:hypothetical protein